MHYNIIVDNKTSEKLFYAIQRYLKQHQDNKIKYHFNIDDHQFMNLYQQMDVGSYENFEEMYQGFNKEVGAHKKVSISKDKYKKVIMLLLAYNDNLINF